MNWILIISTIGFVLGVISLLIASYEHKYFFLQSVYVFIYDHKVWKRYRRLKKCLKTNTIPVINIEDYEEGTNPGFAFIKYSDLVFVIQGSGIYLSSYYQLLIGNLLKLNQHDSRRALQ